MSSNKQCRQARAPISQAAYGEEAVEVAGAALAVAPRCARGPDRRWPDSQSGSSITSRLAPTRLSPQPPALLLSMNTKIWLCTMSTRQRDHFRGHFRVQYGLHISEIMNPVWGELRSITFEQHESNTIKNGTYSRRVELVHDFRSLLDRHASVQSNKRVAILGEWISDRYFLKILLYNILVHPHNL